MQIPLLVYAYSIVPFLIRYVYIVYPNKKT